MSAPGTAFAPGGRVSAWRARRTLPLAALGLAASLGGAALLDRSADVREAELRALRVETQRLERRARRLGGAGVDATLVALEEDGNALRVRLVEALGAARAMPDVGVLHHLVEERAMPADTRATTLRLTLEGRLAHGATLIELIGAVEAAARPWPTETRGCRVQRLDAALAVDCTVDLLHWSGLDAPRGE